MHPLVWELVFVIAVNLLAAFGVIPRWLSITLSLASMAAAFWALGRFKARR